MDILEQIELLDCPLCQGPGILEEVNGWCIYATCLDCGCQTAEVNFNSEEERVKAAEHAARMWNVGKVISIGRCE